VPDANVPADANEDPFDAIVALEGLRRQTFRTPAAGKSSRPFKVASTTLDSLDVQTSRGGKVTLRCEAFQGAVKVLGDLAPDDPEGWVRISDETLVAVIQSENRDKACTSYVLPLLEAIGHVELARTRPARARLVRREYDGDNAG
jgi:hypothetical protein